MHECTFLTTWSRWLRVIIGARSVGEQSAIHNQQEKVLFMLPSKNWVSPALPLLGGGAAGESCSA